MNYRFIKYCGLFICILFLLMGCSKFKVNSKKTYYGQSKIHKESRTINWTTGEISYLVWDSSIGDFMKVEIEKQQITFTFTKNPSVGDLQTTFTTVLNSDDIYYQNLSTNTHNEFKCLNKNQYNRKYTNWSGDGMGFFTSLTIDFNGINQ